MLRLQQVESLEEKGRLTHEYIQHLTGPMDGYWKYVIMSQASYHLLFSEEERVGFCAIDPEKRLVLFHIDDRYGVKIGEYFQALIRSEWVEGAAVATNDQPFFSLCLDYQTEVEVTAYLFTDQYQVENELTSFTNPVFRLAEDGDLQVVKDRCGEPFPGYYQILLGKDALFVLYDGEEFLGIGECRIDASQPQYGDLGVSVAEAYRRRGVATYIMIQLKEECYYNRVIPIASCSRENLGSRKCLEGAGLIARDRLVQVKFG